MQIFCGRQHDRELHEFSEDLLELVKRRALAPETVGVRAAALYLLYALYFRQPLVPKLKVRITLSEFRDVSDFVGELREGQHWDLVYVWARLLQNHAFSYVVYREYLPYRVKGDSKVARIAFFEFWTISRNFSEVNSVRKLYIRVF